MHRRLQDDPPSSETQQPGTFNVLVVGEAGVGKSAIINLIAGKNLACTSPDLLNCTTEATSYNVTFPDNEGVERHVCLSDTVGPGSGSESHNTSNFAAIEDASTLICRLQHTGGIHLLLFCIRGSKITRAMQSNYHLFRDILCQNEVPVALAVTHLETYGYMEQWWEKNQSTMQQYGLSFASHVCITTIRGNKSIFGDKYDESQKAIRAMLSRQIAGKRTGWLNNFTGKVLKWPNQIRDVEDLARQLQTKCQFPQWNAVQLAQRIWSIREREAQCAGAKKADSEETINSLGTQNEHSNPLEIEIARLEETVQRLRAQLTASKKKADKERGNLMQVLRAHEQKHQCEALYTQGRTIEAAESLLEIEISVAVRANKLIMDWFAEFRNRCISSLEVIGDEASSAKEHGEALAAYSTVLSLGPSIPKTLLIKWASTMLIRGSVDEALRAATNFNLPMFVIYQAICDVLEGNGRVTEAVTCFRRMQSELAGDTDTHEERIQWDPEFQRRCIERLDKLGNAAMDSQNYNQAAGYFSTILSLDPVNREILIKRSKARASMNSWADALRDADEAIELDPSCHKGYERKYVALHGAGRHVEAVEAFDMMLLKIEQSPNDRTRDLRHQYVDARPAIRCIIDQTIRQMPRVLVDTASGHLRDKKQQVEAFEALPIYSELVSSMTTKIDYAWILEAVKEFYRYVMLSHKWEGGEPLFQKVEHNSVYELEPSPTNDKLRTFCSLARSLGFRWAWSDTCCVDKLSNTVLQESLVAMFTWYRGSSLTVIYLRDVSSLSKKPGRIQRSIWNSRAWTYQEYIAAETVRFYTEDWKPYLDLTLSNHKESPTVISEMQQGTAGSARDVASLRPGLDRVREKLYLASMRQTTLVEDIAYSLLGIFNAAIPVVYGEGDRAVGRLLEHVLTGSGDVTILAWTGHRGGYNSCLPVDLVVYNQLVPPHVPQPIDSAEMDRLEMELRSSSLDPSFLVALWNRLHDLPTPFMAASRLRLACIAFSLENLVSSSSESGLHVYRGSTSALGDVEIRTGDTLELQDHILIHPWISPILDQEFSCGASGVGVTTRALRLVVRLRQPFGALLLAPLSRVQYRRVATDSLVMARVREDTPLTDLLDGIRTVDIQ